MHDARIELPIHIEEIECLSECWTFNRMIILKTSPYYEDWLASHYHLFVVAGRFHFEQLICTPEIYDTILQRKQLLYFEMTEEEIVNRFKKEIERGFYLNIMTKPNLADSWYHEIVLFGYNDEEKVFDAVGLEGYYLKRMKYSYQFIADMLKEMKRYFKKEEYSRGMRLSEFFQYPISAFRLRDNYSVDGCAFGAFHKLRTEINGVCFGDGTRDVNKWTYSGINCLQALGDLVDILLKDSCEISQFLEVDSVVKILHEHRKMMIISMKYLQKKWDKALGKGFADNIEGYQKCCDIVKKWLYIAIKYKMTNNKTLLEIIMNEIPSVYEKEYMYLDNMVNHCIDWDGFNEHYI